MKNDEDDKDLMTLREQALSSLISKKRSSTAVVSSNNFTEKAPRIQNPAYSLVHDQRPMQQQHSMTPQQPVYNNNPPFASKPFFNPRFPAYHPQGFQPIQPMHPVNTNFHPIPFNPVLPLPIMDGGVMNGAPVETHKFEPTPPARLSPRSAKFVAENEAAMRNSGQRVKPSRRSRTNSRSRSRSPRERYKRRTRSPNIDHIARKRRDPPVADSRPKWQNGEPNRPRPYQRDNRRKFFDNNNKSNRPLPVNKSPETDKVEEKTTSRAETTHHEKVGDASSKNGKETEKQVESEKPKPKAESNREKTEQELEDELLKSTDEEDNADNDDEISLTLDADELDFLDDDEEESEGRFKSKTATTQVAKPKPTFNKFNNNNKRNTARSYESNRNNNNRRSRSPFRHQKKPEQSFKSNFKDKPDKASSTITTSNGSSSSSSFKDNKESSSKSFKSAVTTVPSSSSSSSFKSTIVKDDSQKPSGGDNRIRLNRNKISSRVEFAKTTRPEGENAKTATTGKSEKAIMKRLGGFVGDVKPSTWPQNQIFKILCENLVRDHGCLTRTMGRNLAAEKSKTRFNA